MADWIKWQNDLEDDPRVQGVAARLALKLPLSARVTLTLGACARLWSYFDRQSVDGFLAHLTAENIDARVGLEGFAAAMEAVGWLEIGADGVRIPRFEKHNGETAKVRAQGAQRAARFRSKGGRSPRGPEPGEHAEPDAKRDGSRDDRNAPTVTGSVTNPARRRYDKRTQESESESEAFSGELSRVAFSSAPSRQRPTQRDSKPPEEERWRRAELLTEMRRLEPDGGSDAFFQRVARWCRIPTIERALAATRQAAQTQGVSNLGAYFNRVVTDESRAEGIDLRTAGRPRRARAA